MTTRTDQQRGFTLIELCLSMVLTSIMAVGMFPMLYTAVNTYAIATSRNRVVHNVQHALLQMQGEILDLPPANITGISATSFQFIDAVGAATSFTFANGTVSRGNSTLAPDISALTFTYYDQNNAQTNVLANVRRIGIALTGSGLGQGTFTMRTEVFPRRLLYTNFN